MCSARAKAPARRNDPLREHGLERAFGGEFLEQRRSKASKALARSPGSTTHFCARMPCLSAFCAERALPAEVFGPRDLAPLMRLAAARAGLRRAASDAAFAAAALGAASGLDMAGFLGFFGRPGDHPATPVYAIIGIMSKYMGGPHGHTLSALS
jgi:hypothetical protein